MIAGKKEISKNTLLSTKKIKVLILEDLDSDVDLIHLVLEGFDYTSAVTYQEDEFRQLLSDFNPDIVLSDYTLPGFGGFEALTIVRETGKNIPFIFVTGTLGEDVAVDAIKAGATDFIPKHRLNNLPAAILRAFREQKEKQLRLEEESRFKAIIEYSNCPVLVFSESGAITYVSPAIYKVLGFHVTELIGKTVQEIVDSNYSIKYRTAISKLLNKEEGRIDLCLKFIGKNGQSKFVEAVFNDQRAVEGIGGITCNFWDVHETIMAKQKVEQQQKMLDQVSRIASFGDWKLNISSGEMQWSNIIKQIHEAPLSFNPTLAQALDFFDKKTSHEIVKQAIKEAMTSDVPFDLELKIMTSSGKEKWIRMIGEASPTNVGVKYILGSIQDITIKKNNEILREQLTLNLEAKMLEQKLLYDISRVIHNNIGTVQEVLTNIVEMIPLGWNEELNTVAKIEYDDVIYMSKKAEVKTWQLESQFETKNNKTGGVSVSHLISEGKGKELNQSMNLTQTIAELLQTWLEKRNAEYELNSTLENLEHTVQERTIELNETNKQLIRAHKRITDSINYARYIQQAVLPSTSSFEKNFADHFIFYLPKDVVSGDFYWLRKQDEKIYIVCADCTGHGVPGALMSMIGNELLENIIISRRITRPDIALEEIHHGIIRILKKDKATDDKNINDGMDISLCCIDTETKTIAFSGVYNHGYLYSKGDRIVLEADRYSLGCLENKRAIDFHRTVCEYDSGDRLYLFTDGYYDQPGGPNGKRMMKNSLLTLLDNINKLPMAEQEIQINKHFVNWKQNELQVDDVTVLGIQL